MKLSAPGFGQNRHHDDAKTMKLSPPRQCKNDEALGAWVWSESAAGFGQNRRLGFIRFELSGLLEISHHCVTKMSLLDSISGQSNNLEIDSSELELLETKLV